MGITKLPLLQNKPQRLKVAAYTRVSRDSETLLHSLANQVSYYTKLINTNPEWEFAGVYVDEGITGTSIEERADFQRMMQDAKKGKIDLILTKSVSRFARNTVDLLDSARTLKELNVEVRFEKDNISTFDNDGELMLSLLASFAQAEAESLSENVKWGKRKQMQEGIYHHFSRCYGYEWQGDDFCIIEEEAEVVRFIFKEYLAGVSPTQIARKIDAPSVTGKKFTRCTVKDILKNDNYVGDRTMQKFYSSALRKSDRNYGQLPKYVITDVHEPIISREDFNRVQELMAAKAEVTPKKTFTCFSGIVKCGHCGRACCRRTLHGKRIWKCQGNEISRTCPARYITEEELRKITFSMFADEDEFKRQIEVIRLFDDNVTFVFKNGKEKKFTRKIGRRRPGEKQKSSNSNTRKKSQH